jgi:hypothetical protein
MKNYYKSNKMENIELTAQERYVIAEYGFGYSTDTLIKSEAEGVLKVMSDRKMITDLDAMLKRVEEQDGKIATEIMHILRDKIPMKQRREIVKEYQGDYVSPLTF